MKRLTTLGLLVMLVLGAAGIGFVAGQGSTEEVRVVARSANDGRIEFGIEHDGERILPTGRYMSAAQIGARNDRWLRSTPVTIEVGAMVLEQGSTYTPQVSTGVSGNITWEARQFGPRGFETRLDLIGTAYSQTYPVAYLLLWCQHGDRTGTIHANIRFRTDFTYVDDRFARFGADVEAQFGEWHSGNPRHSFGLSPVEGDRTYLYTGDVQFYQSARQNQWLTVWAEIGGDRVRAEFDLSDLFTTPVQSNLDNCGG